jgi:hypothetical protein
MWRRPRIYNEDETLSKKQRVPELGGCGKDSQELPLRPPAKESLVKLGLTWRAYRVCETESVERSSNPRDLSRK